ncbi:hypothetical protein [uncultured Sphingomonas sp.]|nr:hypothetical protein [uncultured Sphingomonas sp.]
MTTLIVGRFWFPEDAWQLSTAGLYEGRPGRASKYILPDHQK